MRKFLVTILSILYLATSSGAIVHLHYCMGKFTSLGLLDATDHGKCSKCKMQKKKGCCGEKKLVAKVNKDQSSQQLLVNSLKAPVAVVHNYYPDYSLGYVVQRTILHHNINAPPRWQQTPLYIANSVFRI